MSKKNPCPPAEWILKRTVNPEVEFSIIGDFEEEYTEIVCKKGVIRAGSWYWRMVFISVLPFIFNSIIWSLAMLKNYIKIAFRNFRKNYTYTTINILGLATGIACCILTFFFVRDELSFNRFHDKAENIYELTVVLKVGDGFYMQNGTQLPLGPKLPEIFPEVVSSARIKMQNLSVKRMDKLFEEKVAGIDRTFFDIFSFPLKYGIKKNMLSGPDGVVITGKMAKKYFGEEDPAGKTVSINIGNKFYDFKVTGIVFDPPSNSSLQFGFLINIEKIYGKELSEWNNGKSLATFVKLKDKSMAGELQKKFPETINKYFDPPGSQYRMHSLVDFHLTGTFSAVFLPESKMEYSYILSGISLLVLMIACFNFMNLTIGSSSTRSKEIGMRKVMGAQRKELIRQFWFESVLLSFLSLAAGIILAEIFLPVFNILAQKTLHLDYFSNITAAAVLIGITLFTGIVAGSYPAFVISGFASVELFKGKVKVSGKKVFTKILIVSQFAISIFLIIVTGFMYKQQSFVSGRGIGLEPDNVIVVSLEKALINPEKNENVLNILKNRIAQYKSVESVSGSVYGLTSYWSSMAPVSKLHKKRMFLERNLVDKDYINTLGMKLIEGRGFSAAASNNIADPIIVNETLIKRHNIESPIGRKLSEFFEESFDGTIIGVVKDYHNKSLHRRVIAGYVSLNKDTNYRNLYIKANGEDIQKTINLVRKEFKQILPDVPFMYGFLDEEIKQQYLSDEKWNKIVEYASIFAIFIACSGLLGLTLLTVVRRSKEISIRKVLGATVTDIISLVNREFVILVALANIIAWPAAYFTVGSILQNYAYRIDPGPDVFILAGIAAVLVAVTTISLQSLKAALANPVKSLKCE